jgi:hypothetical protein
MTVDIKELVYWMDALLRPSLSSLNLLSAVLSNTIVESALRHSHFKVKTEL